MCASRGLDAAPLCRQAADLQKETRTLCRLSRLYRAREVVFAHGTRTQQSALASSVPSWVFADTRFMRRAVRGLWDMDGSVYKLRFGIQFSFCNGSKPLLRLVRTMLIRLGFHPSEIAPAGIPRIYLTRREELYTFSKTIGFQKSETLQAIFAILKRSCVGSPVGSGSGL